MSERDFRPAHRSELPVRVASAAVLIVVALAAAWLGGYSFFLLCALGGALVLHEFMAITQVAGSNARNACIAAYFSVLAIGLLAGAQLAGLAVGVAIVAAGLLEYRGRSTAWAAAGLAYALAPVAALILLRGWNDEAFLAVFFVFACVWGADTFAYFTGRLVGGPKLAPAISPNKTWSGFFGGLAGAIAAGLIVIFAFGYRMSLAGAFIALILAFISSIGDLLESGIKRRFGKKDSGALIPGHGGAMDRLDGLVFAALGAWIIGLLLGGAPFSPGETGKALVAAIAWR